MSSSRTAFRQHNLDSYGLTLYQLVGDCFSAVFTEAEQVLVRLSTTSKIIVESVNERRLKARKEAQADCYKNGLRN